MIVGRAAAVAHYARNKRLRKEKEPDREGIPYLRVHYEKVKKLNPDVLKYTHTPIFIWFMGIVFIVMGSYLIYHVSGGVKARLFDGFKEGTWWQYLLSIGILLFGVSIMLTPHSEKVLMDRKNDIITVHRRRIVGKKTILERPFSKLDSVKIIKTGIQNAYTNTVQYKIQLQFNANTPLLILESNAPAKTKKRYIDIMLYAGLPCNPDMITVVDRTIRQASSSNYRV